MADDGDGFVGRCEVVEPRRGNRRWPLDLKGRIVAESFQPGVRVVDVARRHGVVAHQLSDWLRQAREGLLSLPLELLPALSVRKEGRCAFVPVRAVLLGFLSVGYGCPYGRTRRHPSHSGFVGFRHRSPSAMDG